MGLNIVNSQPKYALPRFVDPPPRGYIHVAAAVEPPSGRAPFPGRSAAKSALLERSKSLARQLQDLEDVQKATVYRATVIPPPGGAGVVSPARYDVVVLIETATPEVIEQVQSAEPYRLLIETVTRGSKGLHVMAARCVTCVGDVDKSRQGMFLFNYFTGADPQVTLQLWGYLAGWYAVETGMDNSTLLQPVGESDYTIVNHARWNSLPVFMIRQLAKKSFRTYVIANLRANQTVSMPILYRLA